jgi:hypothetical protein
MVWSCRAQGIRQLRRGGYLNLSRFRPVLSSCFRSAFKPSISMIVISSTRKVFAPPRGQPTIVSEPFPMAVWMCSFGPWSSQYMVPTPKTSPGPSKSLKFPTILGSSYFGPTTTEVFLKPPAIRTAADFIFSFCAICSTDRSA